MNQKRCFGIAETRVHRLTRMSTVNRTWMSVVLSSNDVFCKAKNSCLRIDKDVKLQTGHGCRLSESEAMFRHSRNSRSPFDTDVKHKPDMDVRGSKQ